MTPDQFQATDDRLNLWRGAVEQELQDLVKKAAFYRQQINTAKTKTKSNLYEKKFKKITTEILRMVAAKERLDAQKAQLDASKDVSNDAAAAL